MNENIYYSLEELVPKIQEHKKQQAKIILTHGCFDVIHVGHIRLLNASKELGDILVVGLLSDYLVQHFKGKNRPINPFSNRAEQLVALSAVDFIFHMDIQPPLTKERISQWHVKMYQAINPDLLTTGISEYSELKIKQANSANLPVKVIDTKSSISTSNIIEKVKSRYA